MNKPLQRLAGISCLPRISRTSLWRSTARSENPSSGIVDLEQVLIHFISENDGSASALVIGRVQAMTRRRQMFGKASSSPTSSANIRLFGSSLSVDCQLPECFPSTYLIFKGFLPKQHAFYFIIQLQCFIHYNRWHDTKILHLDD